MSRFLSPGRWLKWGCWLGTLFMLLAYLAWQLPQRHWSSSITAAFPAAADWQRDVLADHNASRQLRLVLTGLDAETLAQVATALQQNMLLPSDGVAPAALSWITPEQQLAQLQAYIGRSAGLLISPAAQQQLANGQYAQLTEAGWQRLFSPVPFQQAALAQDPLLLSQQAIEALLASLQQPEQQLTAAGGFLTGNSDGQHFVLLHAQMSIDPFDTALAVPLHDALQQQLTKLQQQYPALRWYHSGVLFHAVKAAQRAQAEMSWYGGLSLLAIVLLLGLVFASATPLLLALATLTTAALAGLAAVVWLFPAPHVLAFVFATTLIGVAIDYSFHGLLAVQQGAAFFRRMLPGLSLSLLSTLLGYAALLLLPMTILNQVAVFMLTGLTVAYLMVRWLYPAVLQQGGLPVSAVARRCATAVIHCWQRLTLRQSWGLLLGAAGCSVLVFLSVYQFSDDVRAFNQLDPQLKMHEQQVQLYSGQRFDNKFLLVSADDPQTLLQRESQLKPLLQSWQQQGGLAGWQALSDWLPSQQAQQQLQQQLQQAYQSAVFSRYFDELGLAVPAPISQWLTTADLPDFLAQQLFQPKAGLGAPPYVSVILLRDARLDAVQLSQLPASANALYFDPVADASARVAAVRQLLLQGLMLAVSAALLLLCWWYGLRQTAAIALFLLVAVLSALNVSLLLGQALTLFHLVGVLLVVALAFDYAIFFVSGLDTEEVQLAVGLSALTSMLAFGMLAFSQTPVIAGFGLTVLTGILVAVLTAPVLIKIGVKE